MKHQKPLSASSRFPSESQGQVAEAALKCLWLQSIFRPLD